MKQTIELGIRGSLEKLKRIDKQVNEIRSKINRLSDQLNELEDSIRDEETRIVELGLKGPSRETGKPSTAKELESKQNYNQKLQNEKMILIQEAGLEQQISREKLQKPLVGLVEAARGASGSVLQ